MLTPRFDEALAYASALHRRQIRKVSGIPYVAHLMSVSALVLEHGGDEDQAIAGLLHDAVEDQGGLAIADEIGAKFGARVRGIVLECSDNQGGNRPPWRVRKEAYISGIASKSDDAILVTCCDKLHNTRSILDDLRQSGPQVFDRFTGRRDGTLWYYQALARALSARAPDALARQLTDTVAEMVRAVPPPRGGPCLSSTG